MYTSEKLLYRSVPECLLRDRLASAWFPSMSRGAVCLWGVLCLVFVATALHRLHHTDLWGHLCYGRWISASGVLPQADLFSAQPSNIPYTNTAWLAQWLGFEAWRLGGEEGLALGHALLATLTCAGTMAAVRARGVNLFGCAVAGMAVYILALPVMGVIRPQLFGMLGFSLTLLASSQLRSGSIPLFWLPLLFAAWSNLHGSFATGLAVLGTMAVGDSLQRMVKPQEVTRGEIVRSWLALGAALVGSCVHPEGPLLLWHVARFGQHEVLATVSEWAALSTEKGLTLVLFATSLCLGLGIMWRSALPRRWGDLLLLALLAVGTISAIRLLAWWAVAWPWLVLPYVIRSREEPAVSTNSNLPTASGMNTLIVLGFTFTAIILAPSSHALITSQPRGLAQVLAQGTPMYVAEECAARKLTGKFFAPLDWADYLVWKSQARLQPLVYTHVHLVTPGVWNDYVRILLAHDDWLDTARRHELRYLLADRDPKRKSPLAKALFRATQGAHPAARVVYQDQRCLLVELLPVSQGEKVAKPVATPEAH